MIILEPGETDRQSMRRFNMSQAEWDAAEADVRRQDRAAALALALDRARPSQANADPYSGMSVFDKSDRPMMDLFDMSEAEWGAAMAASRREGNGE